MTDKTDLEQRLEEGFEVTLTTSEMDLELANRYNLHPGHAYRIIIGGLNPQYQLTYDGIMVEVTVFVDQEGFTLKKLILENGLKSSSGYAQKELFQREQFGGSDGRLIKFGKIVDEKGFYEVRDGIQQGEKS